MPDPLGSTAVKPLVHMSAKLPPRSAPVGTLVENTVPERRRKLSQLKNTNVLSLITAPPMSAPNWFCVKGGGVFELPVDSSCRLLKYSLALNALLRRYS